MKELFCWSFTGGFLITQSSIGAIMMQILHPFSNSRRILSWTISTVAIMFPVEENLDWCRLLICNLLLVPFFGPQHIEMYLQSGKISAETAGNRYWNTVQDLISDPLGTIAAFTLWTAFICLTFGAENKILIGNSNHMNLQSGVTNQHIFNFENDSDLDIQKLPGHWCSFG